MKIDGETLLEGVRLAIADALREQEQRFTVMLKEATAGFATRIELETIGARIGGAMELTSFAERSIALRLESLPLPRDGLAGEMGPAGPKGDIGLTGNEGVPGPSGPAGIPGEQGPPGERGEQGPPGERGDPGLNGEKGERGIPGEMGLSGPQGERGERGEQGLPGEMGLSGPVGEAGPQGIAGPQGQEGPRGQFIAPVHLSDGTEYPEGTIGLWGGGTWYARRSTTSLPDKDGQWMLMADGVRGVETRAVDNGVIVTLKLASGGATEFEISAPVVEHLGAWKPDTEYLIRNEVAWNGATWRALCNTTSEPPGEAWRLVSQRGKSGPRGEVGPVGLAGPKGDEGRGIGHVGWEGKGFVFTMTDGSVVPVVPLEISE